MNVIVAMVSGDWFELKGEHYSVLSSAFMAGKTFFCCSDIHGSQHTIKLSRVESVSLRSDEAKEKYEQSTY